MPGRNLDVVSYLDVVLWKSVDFLPDPPEVEIGESRGLGKSLQVTDLELCWENPTQLVGWLLFVSDRNGGKHGETCWGETWGKWWGSVFFFFKDGLN